MFLVKLFLLLIKFAKNVKMPVNWDVKHYICYRHWNNLLFGNLFALISGNFFEFALKISRMLIIGILKYYCSEIGIDGIASFVKYTNLEVGGYYKIFIIFFFRL